MVKVKCLELRKQKRDELIKQLEDFKREAQMARFKRVPNRGLRKAIGCFLTVLHQKQKNNIALLFKDYKKKPIDLRPRRTRGKRQELTKHEQGLMSQKQLRKLKAFPNRLYAVKY